MIGDPEAEGVKYSIMGKETHIFNLYKKALKTIAAVNPEVQRIVDQDAFLSSDRYLIYHTDED